MEPTTLRAVRVMAAQGVVDTINGVRAGGDAPEKALHPPPGSVALCDSLHLTLSNSIISLSR